jgi:hypothetical protein
MVRSGWKAIAFALLMMTTAGSARAHPLHTSLTQMSFDASRGEVTISVRVFAVDFATAARAAHYSLPAYALSRFKLNDARGSSVALVSCGGKRVGDLLWLCFRGKVAGIDGAKVLSAILFDTYKDQINIVTAQSSRKTVNLLFAPGDRAKRIG